MNYAHRSGVARYGVARITNNANRQSLNVLLLGHDQADAIFMPYDIREALKAEKGDELDFSIKTVEQFGKLCWYVNSIDPPCMFRRGLQSSD